MRFALLAVMMLVVVSASASVANAQSKAFSSGGYFGGHADNPNGATVSPYLNLLQTNSQGISNYQTLVKPMIDQDNAIQRQGQQLQSLQGQSSRSSAGVSGSSGSTGHQVRFGNTSHFFAQGGGGRRSGR